MAEQTKSSRLLEERTELENSFGQGAYLDGLLCARIRHINEELRAIANSDSRDSQRRTALRNVFATLDALDKLCPPDMGFIPEREALTDVREDLRDGFEEDIVGECTECTLILLEGDLGHRCHDAEAYMCASRAFTWDEVAKQWASGQHGGSADDRGNFERAFAKHLEAGGKRADKMVYPL